MEAKAEPKFNKWIQDRRGKTIFQEKGRKCLDDKFINNEEINY